MIKFLGAFCACSLLLSGAAQAQYGSNGGGSSGRMWGAANGASGTIDSSLMHSQNGVAAGEVNSARAGLLYGGANINITAVGSQNIVSTSVYGNNNSTTVTTSQTSSNTGTVTNNGTISPRP